MAESAAGQSGTGLSRSLIGLSGWVRDGLGFQGALVALTASTGFAVLPWADSAYDARWALVSIVSALWVLAFVLRPDWGWRVDPVLVLAACAVGVVVMVSTLTSPFPVDALFSEVTTEAGAVHWLANLVVFVLAASLPLDRRVASGLMLTFVWVVPVAFVGFGQSFFDGVLTLLQNADYYAAAMVLHFAVALAGARSAGTRRAAMAWVVAGAFPVLGTLASGAQSGVAGLVLALAIVAAYAPRALSLERPVRGALPVAAVVAAGLLIIQVPALLRAALSAPFVRQVVGQTGMSRVYFWEAAGRALARRPVLGHGPDGFARAIQGFISPEHLAAEPAVLPEFQLPADAHSFVWTILVLFGVAGAAAFLLLAFVWARRALVQLRPDEGTQPSQRAAFDEQLIRACVVAGLLGYLAVLLFVPLSVLAGSMLSLFAGIAVAPSGALVVAERSSVPKRAWALAAVGLALAVGGSALGVLRIANAAQLHFAQGSPSLTVQYAAIERGVTLEPYRAQNRFLRLLILYRMGVESGDLSEFHRAVDSESEVVTGYGPYLSFLTMLSLNDADASGRKDLTWEDDKVRRAGEIAPDLPIVKSSAMQIALLRGDLEAARAALEVMKRDGVAMMFWEILEERLEAAESGEVVPSHPEPPASE